MIKHCKKIFLISIILMILSIMLSPIITAEWTSVNFSKSGFWMYEEITHEDHLLRDSGTNTGRYLLTDDSYLSEIREIPSTHEHNVYQYSSLFNSVHNFLKYPYYNSYDHNYFYDRLYSRKDKDVLANDIEAFLIYMNSIDIEDDDPYAKNAWHTIIQKAWLVLVKDKSIDDLFKESDTYEGADGNTYTESRVGDAQAYQSQRESVESLIDAAIDYGNYMGGIRNKLAKATGRVEEDLRKYTEEELKDAITSDYRLDFNEDNVSVVKEEGKDYVLLSDLTSGMYADRDYLHIKYWVRWRTWSLGLYLSTTTKLRF